MVVHLSSAQPEDITTINQTPNSTPILPHQADTAEPSGDIIAVINLQLMGTMEQLQQSSPISPAAVSWHSTPRKQPQSAALGTLPAAKELKDPFRPEGMDSITSVPMVTFTTAILIMIQTSPQVPIPAGALSFTHVTPWILQLTLPKTPQMISLHFITWPQAPTQGGPTNFLDDLLQLQEKWMRPWSNYSQTGPPRISDAESWSWTLNSWHTWMMLKPPKPSKRLRCDARMQPVPFSKPTGTMCWC